jgi:hypothetical protein
MLDKEGLKEIHEINGRVKGVGFQTDALFITKNWGQEALEKIKTELKNLGYPVDYEKVKAMEWYPLGLRYISLLVVKELLNLDDEQIKTMGNTAPKFSFIVKMMIKFFVSVESTFAQAANMWAKHFSAGKVISDFHEKEKYCILYVYDVVIHPIFCKYLEGYFKRIAQYILGPDVECEELPDQRQKGRQYVFRISWK